MIPANKAWCLDHESRPSNRQEAYRQWVFYSVEHVYQATNPVPYRKLTISFGDGYTTFRYYKMQRGSYGTPRRTVRYRSGFDALPHEWKWIV